MESLVVEGLNKTFRENKRVVEAVKDVSFSVGEGEMVGLLGPNGAGKTTTIKCILGLVKPDSGRIEVGGVDARKEPRKAAARLAAVLEGARNTYWRLTVWENIVYFAGIHGVSVSRGGDYFKYLLSVLKLEDQKDVEVRKLSSGYKQKTAVACALAKRTPIVFLDEPTLGLDVEASYDLREALRKLQAEEGRTMVISSHDMKVIQDVCSRVIIISRGRIVTDEKIPDLLTLFAARRYKVVISQNGDAEAIRKAEEGASERFPGCEIKRNPQTVEVFVSLSDGKQIYELVEIMRASGVSIETITQEEVDLEKAFLEVVRREARACG